MHLVLYTKPQSQYKKIILISEIQIKFATKQQQKIFLIFNKLACKTNKSLKCTVEKNYLQQILSK